jgi:tetratricopeptide (TPR) repeat protein
LQHRYYINQIVDDYGSAAEIFERGDFMLAAELADEGSELQGTALILAGLTQKGLDILSSLPDPSPRARLVQAFSYWLLDNPAAAQSTLLKIGNAEKAVHAAANKLAQLIEAQEVPVAQFTRLPAAADDHTIDNRTMKVGQFTLYDTCTQTSPAGKDEFDLPKAIDGIGPSPIMIFASVNHWVVPSGFQETAVPKVLWSHDEDIFLYRNHENLRLFDVIVAATSQQHFELSRTVDSFCVSNIFLDPYCTPYHMPEPAVAPDKDIDIIFTGTAFDMFLTDKSEFLFSISKLSKKYSLLFINGHLPTEQYRQTLARARFMPVISRVLGNPSPRWREILQAGGFLLHPHRTLFGRIANGCFSFDPRDPTPDIAAHIEMSHSGSSPYNAHEAAKDIARQFEIHACEREKHRERFIRTLLFMALLRDVLDWRRSSKLHAARKRLRTVWLGSAQDAHFFGSTWIVEKARRLHASLSPTPAWDDKDHNNKAAINLRIALELLRQNAEKTTPTAEAAYLAAIADLDVGLSRYPASLLLNFNRAQWPFIWTILTKNRLETPKLTNRFLDLIARFDSLHFDPLGSDVGSAEAAYHDRIFPYFAYGQAVIKYAVAATSGTGLEETDPSPREALRAAAYGYIGWARNLSGDTDGAISSLQQAIELYPPGNQLLKLQLEILLKTEGDADHARASVAAFEALYKVYPAELLISFGLVIPSYLRAKCDAELAVAFADWFWFACCLDEQTLMKTIPFGQIFLVSRYLKYCDEEILRRLQDVRSGKAKARPVERMLLKASRWPQILAVPSVSLLERMGILRTLYRVIIPTSVRALLTSRLRRLIGM